MNDVVTLEGQGLHQYEPNDIPDDVYGSVEADWRGLVVKQLKAIASLPAGWDSRGGDPPDSRIVASAKSLIDCFYKIPSVAKPSIAPTPSGGVQFSWEYGQRYFEVEVVEPGLARYYFVDERKGLEEEGELKLGGSLQRAAELADSVRIEL